MDLREIGPGVGPGFGIFQGAIRVVPAALEGPNRIVAPVALIDIPNIRLGNGIHRLQHVAPNASQLSQGKCLYRPGILRSQPTDNKQAIGGLWVSCSQMQGWERGALNQDRAAYSGSYRSQNPICTRPYLFSFPLTLLAGFGDTFRCVRNRWKIYGCH